MRCVKLFLYVLSVMMCLMKHSLASKPQTVMTLGNMVREVKNIESCRPSNWSNSQSDACACCIGEQKNSSDKDVQAIIGECKEKTYCTDLLVAALEKDQQVQTPGDLVNKIYDKHVVIKLAHFDVSKLLTAQGKFTEESLKTFLEQAFKNHKLPDKHFSDSLCISVKDLASSGGGNTLQLFLVSSTCGGEKTIYIIKQMAKGIAETQGLEIIRNAPGMKAVIAPNKLDEYPILALPLFYLSYQHNNTDNYLAIMPAANGVSFEQVLDQYKVDSSKQNTEMLQTAFEVIGKQLAHFYEKFMVPHEKGRLGFTVIHGDLRAANIFYDPVAKQAIFIDVETMARSIKKPRTIFVDIMRFVYFSIGRNVFITGEALSGYQKTLFDTALKFFVRGYVSAYPEDVRKQIFYELEKICTETPLGILSQINPDIKPATMITFNKKYVKPLFKELAQEFGYAEKTKKEIKKDAISIKQLAQALQAVV